MRICKDGRIWGQNNKEASSHLGIPTGRKPRFIFIRKSKKDEGYNQGNKNPMFGKKRDNRGGKNPNWKGGISSIQSRIRRQIESKIWRQAVFARDSFTCQECGQRGGRLNAHHIKSFAQYPELRFAIDNGKTLCYKCHKLTENFMKGKVKI